MAVVNLQTAANLQAEDSQAAATVATLATVAAECQEVEVSVVEDSPQLLAAWVAAATATEVVAPATVAISTPVITAPVSSDL